MTHLWCRHRYKDANKLSITVTFVGQGEDSIIPLSNDLSAAKPGEPHILATISALSIGPSKDVVTVEEKLRHKKGTGWDKVIQTSLCDITEPWKVKVPQVRETTSHCQWPGEEGMQVVCKNCTLATAITLSKVLWLGGSILRLVHPVYVMMKHSGSPNNR